MTAASIAHNNLGGLGPDFDAPPTVFYRNAGRSATGRAIDIVLSNTTAYNPRNSLQNVIGSSGHFAQVNLDASSYVELLFSFVYSDNGEPAQLNRFVFTLFDIDEGIAGAGRETLTVSDYEAYLLTSPADIQSWGLGQNSVLIHSLVQGTNTDNPHDPSLSRRCPHCHPSHRLPHRQEFRQFRHLSRLLLHPSCLRQPRLCPRDTRSALGRRM